MGRVDGKIALITGAARGQGAAHARLLAAEGALVIVSDVRDADGTALADELGNRGLYLSHDVASEASWIACAARPGGIQRIHTSTPAKLDGVSLPSPVR